MIAHVTLPVKNYKKAKKLYTAALKPLGYKLKMDFPQWKAAGYMEGGHTSFWIGEKKKMVPGHIALLGKSKQAIQKFHKEALKNGAKDNGGPGFRPDYGPTYYAAFVLDQDGNNVEACYFGAHAPSAKKKRK
jgi:catechol 2,3-dioxygenase-like lactoylglutathione lyase family enzyme